MKILHIDTSSNLHATVSIKNDGNVDTITKQYDRKRSQIVLPMITELLLKNQLQISDIDRIEVVVGPGSFTGLRVGVVIANTLGYFLQIPVNNNPPLKLVEPVYT